MVAQRWRRAGKQAWQRRGPAAAAAKQARRQRGDAGPTAARRCGGARAATRGQAGTAEERPGGGAAMQAQRRRGDTGPTAAAAKQARAHGGGARGRPAAAKRVLLRFCLRLTSDFCVDLGYPSLFWLVFSCLFTQIRKKIIIITKSLAMRNGSIPPNRTENGTTHRQKLPCCTSFIATMS